MQRIGRVLHVSPIKSLILKAENIPRIGDKVVNKRLRPVGRVFDIIGPTISPYVAVKTQLKKPRRLVNHVLYKSP